MNTHHSSHARLRSVAAWLTISFCSAGAALTGASPSWAADSLPSGTTKLIPDFGGYFGGAVALDGNTLVVGAKWYQQGMRGTGVAFVYELTGNQWIQVAKLQGSDTQQEGYFGSSVAIDGGRLVVGDPEYRLGSIPSSGAAYVFEKTASRWTETQKLLTAMPAAQQYSGQFVALSGDRALISAGDGVAAFERTDGVWNQRETLAPAESDGFGLRGSYGSRMKMDGNTVLIAGRSPDDGGLIKDSAVFAYEYGNGQWRETGVLKPSDPVWNGSFGIGLDVSGDTAIIGRPAGGSAADGPFAGAAYIFERVNGQWTETAKLASRDGFLDDGFGFNVAIDGDRAAVLATNGAVGRIYLFEKQNDGSWQESGRIGTGAAFEADQFGIAMAMEDGRLAAGARLDDDRGRWSGAAYVVPVPEPRPIVLVATASLLGALRAPKPFRRVGIFR